MLEELQGRNYNADTICGYIRAHICSQVGLSRFSQSVAAAWLTKWGKRYDARVGVGDSIQVIVQSYRE